MLATLDDLAALGAIDYDPDPQRNISRRATWLLGRASDQVLAYIGITEADIAADTDVWTATRVGVLCAVTCEAAASRLQGSPTTTDGGGNYYPEAYMTSLLQPRHYRALDRLIGSANGSMSIVVERDEASSFFRPYDETV